MKVFYALRGRAQEYEGGGGGAISKKGLHALRCPVSTENYGEDHFFQGPRLQPALYLLVNPARHAGVLW